MPDSLPHLLLATSDVRMIERLAPVLRGFPAVVHVASSGEGAEAVLTGPEPIVAAVLDSRLFGMDLDRLLAAAPERSGGGPIPVLALSENLEAIWIDRMHERVIGDVLPLDRPAEYVALRLRQLIEQYDAFAERDQLRVEASIHLNEDRLTNTLSRSAMLSALFTETDRVQRMGTQFCLILFDVDDFRHWNGRLGTAACDSLLAQAAQRVRGLLRSYDLLGRMGADEFLVALPGCGTANAVQLAERIRSAAFAEPFHVGGKAVRLSACFAVAASQGRTPVVVLRELEEALRRAKEAGPENIETASGCPEAAPVEFLSPTTGDDLLAW
jgi:diguanylate cyclase (GGDEF)-like protein